MNLDSGELAERLSATTERDTVRGMMFKGVLDAATARFGREPVNALRQSLAPKGFGDFATYPAASFLRMLFEIANLGEAQGATRAEMQRFVGAATADAFFASMIGKTLLILWSAGGAPKLLDNVGNGYKQVVSYGSRSFERTGEREGTMRFRGDMMPAGYHEGVLLAALRAVKAPGQVESQPLSLKDLDVRVTW